MASEVGAQHPQDGHEPGQGLVAVRVRPWLVGGWLLGLVGVLVLLHMVIAVSDGPGTRLVNMDLETSLNTWLSALLAAIAAALCWAVASPRRRDRTWWAFTALGALLLLLSVDEVFALHEEVSGRVGNAADLEAGAASSTPLIGVLLLPALLVGGGLIARVTSAGRVTLLAGIGTWFGAAFLLEQLEAWNLSGHLDGVGSIRTVHRVLSGVQEGAELCGLVLVVVGLLLELGARRRRLELAVVG